MQKIDLRNVYGQVPQSFHDFIIRILNALDTNVSSVHTTKVVK